MKIEAFGHTDIGKKRNFNEDSYFCFDLSETVGREDNLIYVLAVADGIGGHVGGEMASFVATQTLRENLLPLKNKAIPLSKFQELFEDSFRQANQKIFLKASEDRSLRGMGTTLVGALIFNNHATISNVGDSRAYLIREDAIHQITQDHSWMAEQLKQNSLTEAEVLNSPFKSMITRSIGFAPELEVDTFQIEISDGDYILLCTDGLYSSL
jgi:serine/threonine protein phosphatase PrpC